MPETFDATVFYAVGDIHGLADRLSALHAEIFNHHDVHHAGAPACIIHLGDYVDRGSNSKGVIEAIWAVEAKTEEADWLTVKSILGNHEQMMLEALAGDTSYLVSWLRNGGRDTLESYRKGDEDLDEIMLNMPKDHLSWLSGLPDIFVVEDRRLVFVHAGVEPAMFPDDGQEPHLWTRSQRFFDVSRWSRRPKLAGYTVVHGHTPVEETKIVEHNGARRINVDLGACYGGPLTAVALPPVGKPTFLQIPA
ncbi:metallophosphoesterase [Ponticaulis koreensis]|uniref:metallophosphoesterase n=1 Tax=Ponticaulis koreensis TaxID=1123045 RepID=UPI0003B70E89|nr:metallophosphoesterase [Ponticaulis koreensis]